MEIRFDDAREDADVILGGRTEPFKAMDCLGGRTFEEWLDGGPMEGRAPRRPVIEGFGAVIDVVL